MTNKKNRSLSRYSFSGFSPKRPIQKRMKSGMPPNTAILDGIKNVPVPELVDRVMVLETDELIKLAEELKLKLSPQMKKKSLQQVVTARLKAWSGKRREVVPIVKDIPQPWSPPDSSSIPKAPDIAEEFPEEGIRIRKMQDLSHEANGVSADSHDKSGRSAPIITKHKHPGKGVTITAIDKALHNVKDGSKWVANKPLIQS